jgi:hypothetical protein
MAGNKKPAKRYRQKEVIRPLNMRNAWMTEGDVHASLLALEAGMATQEHYSMLCAHADIIRRMFKSGPERIQADAIIRMIGIVMSREDNHITPSEELPIRAAIKVTLPALMRSSNRDVFDAAMAMMADLDRFGGVRASL